MTPAAAASSAHEQTAPLSAVNRPLRNMIPTGRQLARSPTVVIDHPQEERQSEPPTETLAASESTDVPQKADAEAAAATAPPTATKAQRNVIPSGRGLARTPVGEQPVARVVEEDAAGVSETVDGTASREQPKTARALPTSASKQSNAKAKAAAARRQTIAVSKPRRKEQRNMIPTGHQIPNSPLERSDVPMSSGSNNVSQEAVASRTRSRSPAPSSSSPRASLSGPTASKSLNQTMAFGDAAAAQRRSRNVIPTGRTLAHTPPTGAPAQQQRAQSPAPTSAARNGSPRRSPRLSSRRASLADAEQQEQARERELVDAAEAVDDALATASSPETMRGNMRAPNTAAYGAAAAVSPATRAKRNAIPSGAGLARTPVAIDAAPMQVDSSPFVAVGDNAADKPQESEFASASPVAAASPAIGRSPLRANARATLTPRVPSTPLASNGWSANDHSAPSSAAPSEAGSIGSDDERVGRAVGSSPFVLARSASALDASPQARSSPLALAASPSVADADATGPIPIGDAAVTDESEANVAAISAAVSKDEPSQITASPRNSAAASAERRESASSGLPAPVRVTRLAPVAAAAQRSPALAPREMFAPASDAKADEAGKSSPAHVEPSRESTSDDDNDTAGFDFMSMGDGGFDDYDAAAALDNVESSDRADNQQQLGMTRADIEFVEESQRVMLSAQLDEAAEQVAAARRRRESLERHHAEAAAQLEELERERRAQDEQLREQISALVPPGGKPLPFEADELRTELARVQAEQRDAERVPATLDETAAEVAAASAAEARRNVALGDRARALGANEPSEARAERSRKRRRELVTAHEDRVEEAQAREKRARDIAARASAAVAELERERERLPPAPVRSALAPLAARTAPRLVVVPRSRAQRAEQWRSMPARQRRTEIAKKRVRLHNLRVAVLKNNEALLNNLVEPVPVM